VKCPITGDTLTLLYSGPVRHGAGGNYVPGKIWYHQTWDMAMLDPENRISEGQYESGEYRARLGQSDPVSRRGKTDIEAFINAPYLFAGRADVCVDFGAGNGSFLDAVKGMYGRTIAIERETLCYETLLRMGHDIERDIQMVDDRYANAVYCLQTLEHLEDWMFYLREFRRILAPSGQIGICVPAFSNAYIKDRPESWLKYYWATHHNWYLSPRSLNYAAARVGLVTIMERVANVGSRFDRLYMRFCRQEDHK